MNAQTKKTDTAKLSQSGKVPEKMDGKVSTTKRRCGRRILVWTILLLLIAIVTSVVLAWLFRFALMENRIRAALAKDGFDVALEFEKLSLNQAAVENITVKKDGVEFFAAKRLVVDYDLGKQGPDRLQRLVLQEPVARISFNIDGRVVSPWFGGGSEPGEPLALPPGGILIEDARLDWTLMLTEDVILGSGTTEITTDIQSATQWQAQIFNARADIATDIARAQIEHDIAVSTKDGQVFEITGTAKAADMRIVLSPDNEFSAQSLAGDFKINFVRGTDVQKPVITGLVNLTANQLETRDYQLGDADIQIDIDKATQDINGRPLVSADWTIAAQEVALKDQGRRTQLADRLTAHSLLANTPVAKEFTRILMGKAERLLSDADLEGRGHLRMFSGGYEVNLHQPLLAKTSGQTLVFTPRPEEDFTAYNRVAQTLDLRADVNWSGVQALEMEGLSLSAKSANGLRLDGVNQIKTSLHSLHNWHNDGQEIRLAPFDLDFAYTNNGDKIGRVDVRGGLDYDGPVPGGFVRGLKADGDLVVRLNQGDFTLGFTPSAPISLTEFSNASGWTAKGLHFNLQPQQNLLQKTGNSRFMQLVLENVRSGLVGPQRKRHLDTKLGRLDVAVDLSQSPQHWRMKIKDTDIKSETFPVPGTHITSSDGTLDVYMDTNMEVGGQITFKAFSPVTHVKTDNVTAENMRLELSGSPDNITAKYEIGRAIMVGDALPTLPVNGTARLMSGVLTGQAITNLPGTTDTPINIGFRSKDGRGTAKIKIPNISFAPNGLQPQHLVPVLRGKLADVSGDVSAAFDFEFGGGLPVRSSGSAELKGLNIGTLVGPVSGIDAHITLASVFPLQTDGVQSAKISGFDPGFPLKDGLVKFEINPDGIRLHQAEWPVANISIDNIAAPSGKISLAPTDWRFGGFENRVVVQVQNIGLATILAGVGKDKLSATGQVSGTLPARINGVNVVIDGGVLGVKDGGVIRYTSAGTEAAGAQNENAGYAFKALRNFRYRQLEARMDGPLDGAMALRLVFDGNNPEVLSGQPFLFDTTITGDLANIARNMAGAFSTQENLSRILEIRDGEK